MSLIDEALKRARQEAARQDSAQAEGRYARVPVYAPPSRSSRAWLLPVVLAVCLAVGIGAGVILSRRGAVPEAPQPAVAEHRVDPRPPRTVTDVPRTATDEPGAPAPANPPHIVEEMPVAVAPRAEAPAPPVLRPEPVQEEAVPPPAAPAPAAPSAPSAGPEIALPATPPASTYDREVPLPDGGTLRLNGIAFSGQPVALFGDKVVAPGESINGFTVVEIERKRVKLQSQAGATVYVTLR